ncbi:tetratricopeptide repeat protein [Pacificoceanicola onchidii]|uniref:tetratricopeptide repeat protein n=1 Tax=Pacificoceanicola onchidii TaxID=2562685 RepID=UPI0010A646C3|nr:tetratricopeptide repeat protein [Pacificoceanicola onchidii]
MLRFPRLLPALLICVTFLAACESDEEKAERFYQSALTYIEDGDVDRALVELRNVFIADGFHKEARLLYAGLQYERGELSEAYGQYLRLVEQYPDTAEARERLGLMALERRNWEEAIRHGEQAMLLAPESTGTRAIAAALHYRTATLARNPDGQAEAVEEARALLEEAPDALAARRVVIDDLLRREEGAAALEQVDAALEFADTSLELNTLRAQLLANLGQIEALGPHLQAMYELYPGNEEIRTSLIRWYISQQDFEGAEAFLRSEAGSPTEDTDGNMAIVELLQRTQGAEPAMAELDALIAAAGDSPAGELYRAARASADFAAGRQDEAIAAMQAVLEGATASDQTRRIRVMLAQMLTATGNAVGAREQVERVLEEDPSHVGGLKLRAAWLIQDDKPGEAIANLRTALDQSPRDTTVLALMAEAHLRDGSPELAQERLSLAVQISNGGVAESVRYARYLVGRNRLGQAESVLINARRNAAGNVEILGLLGEIYLRQQKWPQAQSIIETLRQVDTPQALQLARVYQSSLLLGQNQIEESLDYLRAQIAAEDGTNLSAVIQLVRTQVLTGRLDEARTYVDEQLAENPGSIPLELLSANVHALQGQLQEAEDIYRDLLSRQPDIEPAILQLQVLLRATDRETEAEELVSRSLELLPKSRRLRLLEAYRLEKQGKFEEAIAVYEILYDEQTSDVVVANNLASMLSNHRDSLEDLNRAYAIARRLTGSDVPAFQDTLGWILFLRGDIDEAVIQLEAAAAALPEEPSVSAHLGLAYAKAGRTEEAKAALERSLAIGGETDAPWRAQAEAALAEL